MALISIKGITENKRYYTFLCKYGKNDCVEYLIEKGADLNTKDGQGRTPLFFACNSSNYYRNDDMVKNLVDHGANVKVIDHQGNTPLMTFINDFFINYNEYFDYDIKWEMMDYFANILEYIISHGASLNRKSKSIHSTLNHIEKILYIDESLYDYLNEKVLSPNENKIKKRKLF